MNQTQILYTIVNPVCTEGEIHILNKRLLAIVPISTHPAMVTKSFALEASVSLSVRHLLFLCIYMYKSMWLGTYKPMHVCALCMAVQAYMHVHVF